MRNIQKNNLKQKINIKLVVIFLVFLVIIFVKGIYNKANAATGYTSINSSTIFDKSSLDTLNLNIINFPEVTIEGNEKVEIKDPKVEKNNEYKIIFRNIPKGKKIDAIVTTLFKNCGTLNGKSIDMKIIYSNMIASTSIYYPDESFLFWKTYGTIENQKADNEWWYAGIEKVDIDVSFYYHDENTPIYLDNAYISIYSEDKGEGIYSSQAIENYLYDDTTIEYHPNNYTTEYVSNSYKNLFVGTANGFTESGNKERVGFRYKNKTNLNLTLLSFDDTQNVGYHLRFTPLTGVVPDNPTKTMVQQKDNVKPGEKITYEIKQPLVKRYDESFQYESVIFEDTLDKRLKFDSFKIVFSNGNEIMQSEMEQDTRKMGNFKFEVNLNKITWELDWENQHNKTEYSFIPFQLLIDSNGGWIKFIITAIVKDDVEEGILKNQATTKIQNKYELKSNEVETTIKKDKEIEPEQPRKGKIIVHYVDEVTNEDIEKEIFEEEINEQVTTNSKIIEDYSLTKKPETEVYTTEENEQHVYYYYRYNGRIQIHHIDKINEFEFSTELITGPEGSTLTTHAKENDPDYKIFKKPDIEEYQYSKEIQHVYYYYKRPGKIIVHHIDEVNGNELDTDYIEGLEKDIITTKAKDITNYRISQIPETEQYEINIFDTDVYYYYKRPGRIIVHHIDEVNGNELDTDYIEGLEKDIITTKAKDITNYKISQTPETERYEINVLDTHVYYYYIHVSKGVLVKYIDIITNDLLENEQIIEGYENDYYTTSQKKFTNYSFVKDSENTSGIMTRELIEVRYYYVYNSSIKVHHIYGVNGGEDTEEIKGNEGEKYETYPKENPVGHDGKLYKLNKDLLPENHKGTFEKKNKDIYYYYEPKIGNIIIKHIDKATGKNIISPETLYGYTNDKYETNKLENSDYELVEKTENYKGFFTEGTEEIIYYYLRKAIVIVNYVNEETNEIMETENINGLETEEYSTDPKNFDYYTLLQEKYPKNSKGKFINEPIIIDYYYNPMKFNLKVNQIIEKIKLNEIENIINKTLGKIEIDRKEKRYDLKIYYKIEAINDSEISGNALLKEYIPNGFMMLEEDNPNWQIDNDTASIFIENILPGEKREYFIVLTNINKTITGIIPNKVKIENSENQASFKETTYEDNESNTETIVSIATGGLKITNRLFFVLILFILSFEIFITKLYLKIRQK